MRRIASNCFALLAMCVLLVSIAWMFGLTPEGLLYGQWPDMDDHPTNWDDTTLHP